MTFLICAVIVAVVYFGTSHLEGKAAHLGSLFAWVGVVAGLYTMANQPEWELATLFGIAAIGAMAGIPTSVHASVRRSLAISVPLVSMALVVAGSSGLGVNLAYTTTGTVLVALWASLAAAMACLIAAAILPDEHSPYVGTGLPLILTGGLAGVVFVGIGRSSLPGSRYGFRVRSADEIVQFIMPAPAANQPAIKLDVSVATNALEMLAYAAGIAGVVLVVVSFVLKKDLAKPIWALITGLCIAFFAAVSSVVSALQLPEKQPFEDYIKQIVISKRLPDGLIKASKFNVENELEFRWIDLAPELFVWSLGIGLGLAALHVLFRKVEISLPVAKGYRRDLLLRASVWMWFAWFLTHLYHRNFIGAGGMHGAGEWVALGSALFVSGVTLIVWRPPNKLIAGFATIAAGITGGLVLVSIAVCFRFGSIWGISLAAMP